MNRFLIIFQRAGAISALVLLNGSACAAPAPQVTGPATSTGWGWSTNGPGIFQSHMVTAQAVPGPSLAYYPPPAELPPELRRDILTFLAAANVTQTKTSSNLFDHFLPQSLNNVIWTNFIART